MIALNRWMRDFLANKRIVLAEQPQRLEQLGIVAEQSLRKAWPHLPGSLLAA
jgi:hypothetical protein